MKICACVELMLVSILLMFSTSFQFSIHPSVNICKRNDPNISICVCDNFNKMMPILKNGAPEMRIPPLDPFSVVNVVMDLTRLEHLHFVADLYNITARGASHVHFPKCQMQLDETGLVFKLSITMPVATIDADYDGVGSFLNFTINATGDFHAEIRGISVNATWTGVKYMKDGKEHLDFKCENDDFVINNAKIHFHHIFKNDPRMDDTINALVAENMDVLASEVEPFGEEVIRAIGVTMVDRIFDTFPYDVLFPIA